MVECVACSEEIQSGAKLCKHCGTLQNDTRFLATNSSGSNRRPADQHPTPSQGVTTVGMPQSQRRLFWILIPTLAVTLVVSLAILTFDFQTTGASLTNDQTRLSKQSSISLELWNAKNRADAVLSNTRIANLSSYQACATSDFYTNWVNCRRETVTLGPLESDLQNATWQLETSQTAESNMRTYIEAERVKLDQRLLWWSIVSGALVALLVTTILTRQVLVRRKHAKVESSRLNAEALERPRT